VSFYSSAKTVLGNKKCLSQKLIIIIKISKLIMKIFLLFSVVFLLTPFSASAGLYRWVDEQGNVSYSDKIPPTAVKYGHVELNNSGVEKKSKLSAVQKKEVEKIKQQKKKEQKIQRENAIKAALKKMQDEQLLSIYSNRNELINVYEGKITMSSKSVVLLKARHKVLSKRLEKTEIKHEKMKNPKFKKILEGKIDDMLDGLKVYQQAITENMVEKSKLKKEYDKNLKRFDNLTKKQKDPASAAQESKVIKQLEKALSEIRNTEETSKVQLAGGIDKKKKRVDAKEKIKISNDILEAKKL